jgi:hypothetical protein
MDALLFGLSLGFIAGISPGPLMTLVLSESLRRGFRAGAITSLAPLISDTPVIVLSLVALRQVPERFLTVLTLAGGLLVIFLGVRTIAEARTLSESDELGEAGGGELLKAALVNLLNPLAGLGPGALAGGGLSGELHRPAGRHQGRDRLGGCPRTTFHDRTLVSAGDRGLWGTAGGSGLVTWRAGALVLDHLIPGAIPRPTLRPRPPKR